MANLSDKINSKINQVTLEGTRTNTVDNTLLGFSATNWSITTAKAYAHKTEDGEYWLVGTMQANFTAGNASANTFMDISGFSLPGSSGTEVQAISGNMWEDGVGYKEFEGVIAVNQNGGQFQWHKDAATGAYNKINTNFNIRLASEPTWFQDNLQTASGIPVATATTHGVVKAPNGEVYVHSVTARATDSSNDITPFDTVEVNTGTSITYASSASAGDTFTINEDGIYAITYWDINGSGGSIGISLNQTTLTYAISQIPASEILSSGWGASSTQNTAVTARLSSGDIIRAVGEAGHGTGTAAYQSGFRITQVAVL